MPIELRCAHCGSAFRVPPSQAARPNRRYCTMTCREAARRAVGQATFEARFWEKVSRSAGDDCWEWTGYRHEHGYGRMTRHDGLTRTEPYAHRLAWEYTNGPVPDGLEVLHRCDNPPCCNPAHLFLGTQRDNNADRDAKGRTHRGERTGNAVLTAPEVRVIRDLYAGGWWRIAELARLYGVNPQTIADIVQGRHWRHL